MKSIFNKSHFVFLRWSVLILFITLTSCSTPWNRDKSGNARLSFAGGFGIKTMKAYRSVEVYNPWQSSVGKSYKYILASDTTNLPDSLKSEVVIKIPVRKVIVFSTTHVGFISALGQSTSIAGVSGKDFVNDSTVRSSITSGHCADIGYFPNIDFESVLRIAPDVVFLYGLDPSVVSIVNRLEQAGIKSVLVSEFLENHPLGKAEWIKFFAAFYGLEEKADSIYSGVEKDYIALARSVESVKYRPKILTGLPWKDTWFISGGASFTARFIADAGGDFLWKENKNTEFIPLDLESVFQKALKADIWINTGSAPDLETVGSVDSRFTMLPVYQKGMLFNNNLKLNTAGGNDFWESGAVRPDLILNDLICIFHPELCSQTELNYYMKLN
jgi:iron complex transport system substrate-binding protein